MALVVADKPWSVIVGGGGVILYFYRLGTTTSVLSMEDTDFLLSHYEQSRHTKNDIYFKFLEVVHANLLRTAG